MTTNGFFYDDQSLNSYIMFYQLS